MRHAENRYIEDLTAQGRLAGLHCRDLYASHGRAEGFLPRLPQWPSFQLCIVTAVCAVCMGCSGEPFEFVQVSGKVAYEDGTPLPTKGGLRVIFSPTASPVGDMYPPSGAAFPDADGKFERVSSSRKGGGIVRGEHKVVVLYQDLDSRQFIPKEYTNAGSTPLVVNSDDAPFEIRIPRP